MTVAKVRVSLGVLMHMVLIGTRWYEECFSVDTLNKMPFFPMVFSRERLLHLLWVLHMPQDMEGLARQPARGSKIRSTAKYIDRKCQEHFSPEPKICEDESTIGIQGQGLIQALQPAKANEVDPSHVHAGCLSHKLYIRI